MIFAVRGSGLRTANPVNAGVRKLRAFAMLWADADRDGRPVRSEAEKTGRVNTNGPYALIERPGNVDGGSFVIVVAHYVRIRPLLSDLPCSLWSGRLMPEIFEP